MILQFPLKRHQGFVSWSSAFITVNCTNPCAMKTAPMPEAKPRPTPRPTPIPTPKPQCFTVKKKDLKYVTSCRKASGWAVAGFASPASVKFICAISRTVTNTVIHKTCKEARPTRNQTAIPTVEWRKNG